MNTCNAYGTTFSRFKNFNIIKNKSNLKIFVVKVNNNLTNTCNAYGFNRVEIRGDTMPWIDDDRYLNQQEMENNANIIIAYYRSIGINDSTIASILGNMQAESTLSPRT